MIVVISRKKKRDIDENLMAEWVTELEGKKQSISIAQVKEVQRLLLDALAAHLVTNPKGLLALLRKHGG